MNQHTTLFSPLPLGPIQIKNRIVMAPMTRSRAIGNVPNDLMAKYYSARADAGLIITEGTSPSPNGLGYPRIPGLFNQEQVIGWRSVTDAVHRKGGRIFVQLMHTGRTSHPLNMAKETHVLSSSALKQSGTMYTDERGLQEYPLPEAMTVEQIETAVKEHIKSAGLAISAGFDGVELHGANGYLIEQFLNPNINKRTDAYGKDAEGRMKFLLDIAKGTAERIGANRLGVRVSPYGASGDAGAFSGIDTFYATLAENLSMLGLLYIHVVDHSSMGAPVVSPNVKQLIRSNFKGLYILSGGYTADRAEVDLVEKRGDLVAFGRPFIANPDLVEKLKNGGEIKAPEQDKLYTAGPEGYTEFTQAPQAAKS